MRKDLELLIKRQRYPHLAPRRTNTQNINRNETPTSTDTTNLDRDRERIIQKIQNT